MNHHNWGIHATLVGIAQLRTTHAHTLRLLMLNRLLQDAGEFWCWQFGHRGCVSQINVFKELFKTSAFFGRDRMYICKIQEA